MKTYTFELGQLGTNSYLIFPDDSDLAVLVDAPFEAADTIPPFLEKNGRKLAAILLTHGHWDHIWDAAKLAAATGAKIFAGEEGRELIENPEFQRSHMYAGGNFDGAKINYFPKDEETIDVAGLKIKCLSTPGHCPGSFTYFIEDPKDGDKAFVGDVLFEDSVGRTDLWGGDFSALEKSIRTKIFNLPPHTIVCTGHGPKTTVEHERAYNPYVSA